MRSRPAPRGSRPGLGDPAAAPTPRATSATPSRAPPSRAARPARRAPWTCVPKPTLVSVPARTAFCPAHGVAHELEFKRRARDAGRITYHMARRPHRLAGDEWAHVAALPVQPHLGDHMIGTPASVENASAALAAGITSIGNLGQFFAFEPPGGYDDARADGRHRPRPARDGGHARRARALLSRRRAGGPVLPLRRLRRLGRARALRGRGAARRAARALLRRADPRSPRPRDRRLRARRPARARLDRHDGLRQHGRLHRRPRPQPRVLAST